MEDDEEIDRTIETFMVPNLLTSNVPSPPQSNVAQETEAIGIVTPSIIFEPPKEDMQDENAAGFTMLVMEDSPVLSEPTAMDIDDNVKKQVDEEIQDVKMEQDEDSVWSDGNSATKDANNDANQEVQLKIHYDDADDEVEQLPLKVGSCKKPTEEHIVNNPIKLEPETVISEEYPSCLSACDLNNASEKLTEPIRSEESVTTITSIFEVESKLSNDVVRTRNESNDVEKVTIPSSDIEVEVKLEPEEETTQEKPKNKSDKVITRKNSRQERTSKRKRSENDSSRYNIPGIPPEQQLILQEEFRDYCSKELRSLQLSAYSECMSALRAGGILDENKHELMEKLKQVFMIPKERHQAEIRRVIANDHLCVIADTVTGIDTSAKWKLQGYDNTPLEPKILSYNIAPDDNIYLTLSTIKITNESAHDLILPTGDLPSIHCIERDHRNSETSNFINLEDQKPSVAVPADIPLKIEIDQHYPDEVEEHVDAKNKSKIIDLERESNRRVRAVRLAASNKENKKQKIVPRKSQTSPDITSSPSSSPKKPVQTSQPTRVSTPERISKPPLKKTLSPEVASISASPRKEKLIKDSKPPLVEIGRTVSSSALSLLADVVASTSALQDESKPLDICMEKTNTTISTTRRASSSRVANRGRGHGRPKGRPTTLISTTFLTRGNRRGAGTRGGLSRRENVDEAIKRKPKQQKSIGPSYTQFSSLESNEEMPTSPQLVSPTKVKPKRKVLKVKKSTAQSKDEAQRGITKNKRKVKLEQKNDDDDFTSYLQNEDTSVHPIRGLSPLKQQQSIVCNHTDSPVNNYFENIDTTGISSSALVQSQYKPLGSSEVPAKMRHKTNHTLFSNENNDSEGNSNITNHLPKYNFNNEELQSHFKSNLGLTKTTTAATRTYNTISSIPPPVFSTTLNLSSFHKKRTQLLLPSTYQNLGKGKNDEMSGTSGSETSGTTSSLPAFTTASSLAAARLLRPTPPPAVASAASKVLFEQQMKQGLNAISASGLSTSSTNTVSSLTSLIRVGSSGSQPTPIIHRKARPHILSNSKLLRNLSNQNSNSNININSSASSSSALNTTGSFNTNSIYSTVVSDSNDTVPTTSTVLIGGVPTTTATSLIKSSSPLPTQNINLCNTTTTQPVTSTSPPNVTATTSEFTSPSNNTNSTNNVNNNPPEGQKLNVEILQGEQQQGELQTQQQQNTGTPMFIPTIPISEISNINETNLPISITPPIITTTATSSAIPLSSVGSPIYTRSPQTGNIIYLQKSVAMSSMPTATPIVVNSSTLSSAGLPVPTKNTSRAVILRRTNTGGPGNMVILDMQKNQILNPNQVPQFLKGAKFVNSQSAPLLNASSATMMTSPRKIIQANTASFTPIRMAKSSTDLNNFLQHQQQFIPRKARPSAPVIGSAVTIGRSNSGVGIPSLRPVMALRPVTSLSSSTTIPSSFKVLVQPGNTSNSSQSQPPPLQVVQRLLKGDSIHIDPSHFESYPDINFLPSNFENNEFSDIKISNVTSNTSLTSTTHQLPQFTISNEVPIMVTNYGGNNNSINYQSTSQSEFGTNIQVAENQDIFELALKSSGIEFSPSSHIYLTESKSSDFDGQHYTFATNEASAEHPSQYITHYEHIDGNLVDGEVNVGQQQQGIQIVMSSGIETTHHV